MRTVGDLRKFMEKHSVSPEKMSKFIHISNMTIRRLLKMSPKTTLPPKYLLQFESLKKMEANELK